MQGNSGLDPFLYRTLLDQLAKPEWGLKITWQ